MKETFLKQLKKLFPKHVKTFTSPQFICEDALKKGAVKAITVSSEVDFNFDKKGNLVGINTGSIGSFVGVKRKK